jgi:hypothetical protein
VRSISTPEYSKPIPGEFRVAHREGALPYITLVIAAQSDDVSLVMLVSEDIEYATHRDVLIERTESGLTLPMMVETDICVPVFNHQLDEPVGRLTEELSALLQPRPDVERLEPQRHGIPLAGPEDSRWKWKEGELAHANALSGPCYTELVS